MSHHKSRGSREDHRGRSSSGRRPPLGGGGGGPGAQGGPGGDWTCPEDGCANVNFARRAECNRCGAVKPSVGAKLKAVGIEIGTNMAEKSGGLFSADDWQCGKCGNVNWARRSTCNVCNGPRVTEIEQRTGLGGGFNERQDRVEYKRHDSDSDEYDDFGRRKKSVKKKPVTIETPPRRLAEFPNNRKTLGKNDEPEDDEEDDDEDDDDDDEEDLGKYDLWGDDNVDVMPKKGSNNPIDFPEKHRDNGSSSSRKRSHSRSSNPSSGKTRRRSHQTRGSRSRTRSSGSRSSSRSRSRGRARSRKSRRSRSRSSSRSSHSSSSSSSSSRSSSRGRQRRRE
ncbi:zinc finger Ran-binding domain-containing protein 2-like isoform X3 [Tigriopus californicus]|uniref:zinc finger Ran-binding domain-containing protein 2-like isoform X3 n=1 Tax=Tigriopus californicus TaxID=6832 RepID=UPI0027D9F40C|nr:zinc finger Ran-binding domain-containing protein 2-like isoform X3 [Tigriopus californicus]XP_059092546.1 zinc finger Ran-binding domain-containing protein 2-like isoform X3 [Tigriopus californicus]